MLVRAARTLASLTCAGHSDSVAKHVRSQELIAYSAAPSRGDGSRSSRNILHPRTMPRSRKRTGRSRKGATVTGRVATPALTRPRSARCRHTHLDGPQLGGMATSMEGAGMSPHRSHLGQSPRIQRGSSVGYAHVRARSVQRVLEPGLLVS